MTTEYLIGGGLVSDIDDNRSFMLRGNFLVRPFEIATGPDSPTLPLDTLYPPPAVSMGPEVQTITAVGAGFYNKPLRPDLRGTPVKVVLFAGGGGGGGGIAAVAATAVSGGAGGGGGGRMEFTTIWDYIGVKEAYVLGTGGSAGAAGAVGGIGMPTSIGGSTYFMANMPPATGNAPVSQWDQAPYAGKQTTLNPNDKKNSLAVLSNGNLTMTGNDAFNNWAKSTTRLDTTNIDSVYIEFTVNANANCVLGLADSKFIGMYPGVDSHSFGLFSNGMISINGQYRYLYSSTLVPFVSGTRVGMVYSLDGQRVWYRVDSGNWNGQVGCDPSNQADPFGLETDLIGFAPTNNELYVVVGGDLGCVVSVSFGGFSLPRVTAYAGGGGAAGSAAASGGGGGGSGAAGTSGAGATAGVGGLPGGGAGGSAAVGTAAGSHIGGGGGGGGSIGNVGSKGGLSYGGGPGGSAGGGKNATPTYYSGGAGAENPTGVSVKGGTPITEGTDGYLHGYKPGQPGQKGRLGMAGTGGSGGAASASAPGPGGAGGYPAGGGGGGGCSLSPNAAGAGGKGGNGQIILVYGFEMGHR